MGGAGWVRGLWSSSPLGLELGGGLVQEEVGEGGGASLPQPPPLQVTPAGPIIHDSFLMQRVGREQLDLMLLQR